jgi:hypothetical protein
MSIKNCKTNWKTKNYVSSQNIISTKNFHNFYFNFKVKINFFLLFKKKIYLFNLKFFNNRILKKILLCLGFKISFSIVKTIRKFLFKKFVFDPFERSKSNFLKLRQFQGILNFYARKKNKTREDLFILNLNLNGKKNLFLGQNLKFFFSFKLKTSFGIYVFIEIVSILFKKKFIKKKNVFMKLFLKVNNYCQQKYLFGTMFQIFLKRKKNHKKTDLLNDNKLLIVYQKTRKITKLSFENIFKEKNFIFKNKIHQKKPFFFILMIYYFFISGDLEKIRISYFFLKKNWYGHFFFFQVNYLVEMFTAVKFHSNFSSAISKIKILNKKNIFISKLKNFSPVIILNFFLKKKLLFLNWNICYFQKFYSSKKKKINFIYLLKKNLIFLTKFSMKLRCIKEIFNVFASIISFENLLKKKKKNVFFLLFVLNRIYDCTNKNFKLYSFNYEIANYWLFESKNFFFIKVFYKKIKFMNIFKKYANFLQDKFIFEKNNTKHLFKKNFNYITKEKNFKRILGILNGKNFFFIQFFFFKWFFFWQRIMFICKTNIFFLIFFFFEINYNLAKNQGKINVNYQLWFKSNSNCFDLFLKEKIKNDPIIIEIFTNTRKNWPVSKIFFFFNLELFRIKINNLKKIKKKNCKNIKNRQIFFRSVFFLKTFFYWPIKQILKILTKKLLKQIFTVCFSRIMFLFLFPKYFQGYSINQVEKKNEKKNCDMNVKNESKFFFFFY